MKRYTVKERTDWRWWVTPKPLEGKPIHRWYIFPHSFTSELVHALADEWGLGQGDRILDPFAGAGTTILAAKDQGIPATGYDLSPLAVFATRAKIANYQTERLECIWRDLTRSIDPSRWDGPAKEYPELVRKALPGKLLGAFDAIDRSISELPASKTERDFFRLALLTVLPRYSRAVASGGWLRWVRKRNRTSTIIRSLTDRVVQMLGDLESTSLPRRSWWSASQADARSLPDASRTYSAVITSPPYPNRHDYTRVFGVELLFGFLNWEDTRQLRYQSFHSHPEAHPKRPGHTSYVRSRSLRTTLRRVRRTSCDPRVLSMLEGYFLDMYLALREIRRVCRKNARIAVVLGNAQYAGVPIPVDTLTAEIGEQVGLSCEKLLVVRYRGNSAQQMGRFGRSPSRETIVQFSKP